jgi:hypothetical protein
VSAQAPAPQGQTGAVKFDEFGSVGHCDVTARLDNLAIQVQQIPAADAYLIAYAPAGRGEMLLELTKEYLVNTRGLAPDRIKTIYGGRNIDLTQPNIQLWIVPKGAQPPEPENYKTNIDTFKGLFADEPGYDRIDIDYLGGEDMGPGIGNTIDLSFVDILQQQKNAVGYLVVYTGDDATPGAWRRIAQREVDHFKSLNLDPSRLKVIFGGQLEESRIQLWVSPSGEPPPVSDAGPEPPLNKTVSLPGFDGYELAEEKNQAAVFNHLLEILREEKTARAFVAVRLEQPNKEEPSEEVEPPEVAAPAPPPVEESTEAVIDEPQPQPADLTKVVEKWRHDFINTHKMSADRLIVVFVPAREFDNTQLDLWIVPKGQPLPDPNEEPKDLMDEFPEADPTDAKPLLNHLKVDQKPAHEIPVRAKRP